MGVSMRLWFCLTLVTLTLGARELDRITYLPGLDPQPPFKMYSGFLQASGTNKLFYWFVESENDPANDPVVLWLNGGPGCSSMTGFLLELGPFRVNPDGETLTYFEHRWNRIANIIFMESPAGVGFSYNDELNYTSSDDWTAFNNHEALLDFFQGFPEYKNNDFFVTGESYAGVYVPTLSARLVDDNKFNFKGFAVGNPVTDRSMMANSQTYYCYYHGLYDDETWSPMLEHCCVERNSSNCNFYDHESEECQTLLSQRWFTIWRMGLNPYNYLADCAGGVPDSRGVIAEDDTSITVAPPDIFASNELLYQEYIKMLNEVAKDKVVYSNIPCTDSASREKYLNNPAVRDALHVPHNITWEICSSEVSRNYQRQYSEVSSFFKKVIDAGHPTVLYSGDLDMACDFLGSSWFIDSLNQTKLDGYKYWTFKQTDDTTQIAGFVKQFERLKFVLVKGAGHFVPTDKPQPAFDMFERFIKNQDYN